MIKFCQNFILYAKRVDVFIIDKYKQIIKFVLLLIYISIAPYIGDFFIYIGMNLSSVIVLKFLIMFTLWLVGIYIYFTFSQKVLWLEKNQGFIVTFGILMSCILFFSQQFLTNKDLFLKQAVVLAEENNRNNNHLQNIKNDIKKYPSTIFWKNFSTNSYKEYWSYIHLNYPQACKDLYAGLTISFDILNNMIQKRNDLLIRPQFIQMDINILNEDIFKAAEQTEPTLNKIIGECQQNQ